MQYFYIWMTKETVSSRQYFRRALEARCIVLAGSGVAGLVGSNNEVGQEVIRAMRW